MFICILHGQMQQIKPILEAVAYCIQYPSDSPAIAPEGFREKQEWDETNEIMNEQRQDFFVLFKNTAKLSGIKGSPQIREKIADNLCAKFSQLVEDKFEKQGYITQKDLRRFFKTDLRDSKVPRHNRASYRTCCPKLSARCSEPFLRHGCRAPTFLRHVCRTLTFLRHGRRTVTF